MIEILAVKTIDGIGNAGRFGRIPVGRTDSGFIP